MPTRLLGVFADELAVDAEAVSDVELVVSDATTGTKARIEVAEGRIAEAGADADADDPAEEIVVELAWPLAEVVSLAIEI